MKIAVLDRATIGFDVSVSPIEALGETVIYDNIEDDKINSALRDADVCVINKKVLGAHNLGGCGKLKLICLFATGYNNVDIEYCRSHGIKVRNIPNYCTMSVCQHTFAMALSLIESIGYYDNFVKSGAYSASGVANHLGKPFFEIAGKTWGIIGLGNIGRSVAKTAETMGANVIYASLSGVRRLEEYERVTLDTLLKESDIVSIHSPLTDKTKNLIDAAALAKMKRTSIIINVGRGGTVNLADLAEAVDSGMISGAAIDVYPTEPPEAEEPLLHLKHPERLILTPHIAWSSVEARKRCVEKTAENIRALIENKGSNDVC